MIKSIDKRRSAGRPRSERTRVVILVTALRILKKAGLNDLTMSGLAKDAGVSTATLYRWWKTKEEIALDAFHHSVDIQFPLRQDIQNPLDQLRDHVRRGAAFLKTDLGRVWLHLLTASQNHEVLQRNLLAKIFLPRRKIVIDLLNRAKKDGEISKAANSEVLADLVFGPLYYRAFISHRPLTKGYAGALFDMALSGVRTDVKRRRPAPRRRQRSSR